MTAAEPHLAEITVKGQSLQSSREAFTVNKFSQDDIQSEPIPNIESMWCQVPGMHIDDYQLGGVVSSVVMRGFSGGGHGGDIGFTLDGMPLNEAMSHADGYADLGLVIPLELEEVAIHKGPVSVLQGNFNRAGLVELRTRRSGSYRDVATQAGSHGTLDTQAAFGLKLSPDSDVFLAAQHARTQGSRPSSDDRRSTLSGRWQHRIDAHTNLVLSARVHEADADSPSYLSLDQWQQDPQGKDPRVLGDGAQKHFRSVRADFSREVAPHTRAQAYAYATQQDFVRWFSRPGGGDWVQREEHYDREIVGLGVNAAGRFAGDGRWSVGLDHLRERTDHGYWEGLQQRVRTSDAIYDRLAKLNNTAVFAQLNWAALPWLQPSVGVRWDSFSGACRRLGVEQASDACEQMKRISHLSPKLGVAAHVNPQMAVRANWSEGFALPSDYAKYGLGAQHLDPNIFRQSEVGVQWKHSKQLWLDASLFHISSSQEIRETAPGQYENFGRTRRKGLELQAHWAPVKPVVFKLSHSRVMSRVTQHANPAQQGLQVTAVPRSMSTLQASWQLAPQWRVFGSWRHVGRMAITADNLVWSKRYGVADLGVQRRLQALGGEGSVSLLVNNVADKRYASSMSVIGGQPLVAPGAPRTVMLGMNLSFR